MHVDETAWISSFCLIFIILFCLPLQRVLKDIVLEKLPALYGHFTTHQCDLSLFAFNWFLVLFVDSLPITTYLRIWDSFLYEGSKVLLMLLLLMGGCVYTLKIIVEAGY